MSRAVFADVGRLRTRRAHGMPVPTGGVEPRQSPAPFGADMPARRRLHGLALSYQVLGTSLTARLASLRPGPGGAVRMRALLQGRRRASIVPVPRGFLAAPLDTQVLDIIESPTLILTQRGDALHPLRSGEVLYDLLSYATLCVAPTATFWDRRRCRRLSAGTWPAGRGGHAAGSTRSESSDASERSETGLRHAGRLLAPGCTASVCARGALGCDGARSGAVPDDVARRARGMPAPTGATGLSGPQEPSPTTPE